MLKFAIARDDSLYLAWPDVALLPSGRLVCTFAECTHHGNRDYSRFVVTHSDDRGRTWSPRRPVSIPLRFSEQPGNIKTWWNCPRIVALGDHRLVVIGDRLSGTTLGPEGRDEQSNWLWFSNDSGESWSEPHPTPVEGIVPDRLLVLRHGAHAGRWILGAHRTNRPPDPQLWSERLWYSDDQGKSWHGPIVIAESRTLKLCEGNTIELPDGKLVCFLRENSNLGLDAFKCVSQDGGLTWEGPNNFPLPGCHRPVAGVLQSGRVLITYRFMHGGRPGWGSTQQNFFAAITSIDSCLASERHKASCRIMPIDYDRSPHSDLGYSGWVQFPDGEIYIVQYIVDDAPKGQIRGYSLRESEFLIT